MNIYQTYALLVIGIINIRLDCKCCCDNSRQDKLINHIHTLWRNKKPIENFIRPNSRFDYQFKLKRDQHNNLIDDKTWSDLNMEEIFHRSNFNFTAIERCVGLPHYAICLRSITKQLLDQFNNDETFRSMYLIISLLLAKWCTLSSLINSKQ